MGEYDDEDGAPDVTESVQLLFVRHENSIRAFVRSLQPSLADADDVMQETFLTISRKSSTFEPGSNFLAWACGIARFKVLENFRQRKRANILSEAATTAYVDAQHGRVLEALAKSPYKDNTIVIFISDHGFHLAEKDHWQKGTLWEEATNSMLMCRVPGMTKPGGSTKACVSLQDLYPTLLDLCQMPKPDHVDGKSLAPLLKNPQANWESTAISYLYDRYASIRTEQFRYIRYQDGQQELYDHKKDPHEWKNEADNPKYTETLETLKRRLPALEHMASQLVRNRKK